MNLRLSSMRKHRIKQKPNPQKIYQTIDVVSSSLQKSLKRSHPEFFLPPLQHPYSNQDFFKLRNSIANTVKKLQDKIFIPHNAAKKRNLELIRKRRGSDLKAQYMQKSQRSQRSQKPARCFSMQQKTIATERQMREISLDQKMNSVHTSRNQIASCSLQDSVYYG